MLRWAQEVMHMNWRKATLIAASVNFALFLIGASDRTASVMAESQQTVHRDANLPSTITLKDAENLLDLLPATKGLRDKGMDVRWDVQAVPDMNNRDYYFFWV